MKNILFVLVVFPLLFNSCTVTNYSGEIYPTTVQFDKANFKYIKTIKGSSEATYEYGGWDKKKSDGLVNEAKTNMYDQHPLQENQVPTNITVDILREGAPNYQSKSMELRKVRVVITADIFEFSNNGVYSENFNENLPVSLDEESKIKNNDSEKSNEYDTKFIFDGKSYKGKIIFIDTIENFFLMEVLINGKPRKIQVKAEDVEANINDF